MRDRFPGFEWLGEVHRADPVAPERLQTPLVRSLHQLRHPIDALFTPLVESAETQAWQDLARIDGVGVLGQTDIPPDAVDLATWRIAVPETEIQPLLDG